MPAATNLTGRTELFREDQSFAGTWFLVPVLVAAAFAWYFLLDRMIWHPPPATDGEARLVIWLVFVLIGLLVPVLFVFMRLRVTVDREEIRIRFRPVYSRAVPIREVFRVEATTYRPILEFGGWGLRYSLRRRAWAYTVSGTEGVYVEMNGGKRILIGSQNAATLAAAITRAREG